jgi:ribosomal protein L37E
MEKEKRKYWYSFYTQECPICGGGTTDKQREYSAKPDDYNARHEFVEVYDYCNE